MDTPPALLVLSPRYHKTSPVLLPIVCSLDPQQGQSKDVWEKLVKLADDGLIVLHAVPLATTSADRLIDIAAILGSENKREAWEKIIGRCIR